MTTLPPYKPEDHRVLPPEPPLWKTTLLVIVVFVGLPLLAGGVVAGIMALNLSIVFYVLALVALIVGGVVYGVRNMEHLQVLDDEDDLA